MELSAHLMEIARPILVLKAFALLATQTQDLFVTKLPVQLILIVLLPLALS